MPNDSELWSYGALSERPCNFDAVVLVYGEKHVRGMYVQPLMIAQGTRKLQVTAVEIQKAIRTVFRTEVRSTVAPEEFQQAIADYEANMSTRKLMLRLGDLD